MSIELPIRPFKTSYQAVLSLRRWRKQLHVDLLDGKTRDAKFDARPLKFRKGSTRHIDMAIRTPDKKELLDVHLLIIDALKRYDSTYSDIWKYVNKYYDHQEPDLHERINFLIEMKYIGKYELLLEENEYYSEWYFLL